MSPVETIFILVQHGILSDIHVGERDRSEINPKYLNTEGQESGTLSKIRDLVVAEIKTQTIY